MLSLRLLRILAVWGLVVVAWAHAWITTVAASTFDSRVPWALPVCLLPWLLATLAVGWLARRRPGTFTRLDGSRHALGLAFVALAANAASHVMPDMTIRALREEVPPLLLPLYPLMCGLLPIIVSVTGRTRDVAAQGLGLAAFVLAMSGAPFLLTPAAALMLAIAALALQLAEGGLPERLGTLRLVVFAFTALMALATATGRSLPAAVPSLTWILAATALMLAVSLRPRGATLWRDLFACSTLSAVIVALAGAAVTAWLARTITPDAALDTRLVLFRWHPNFLAPFFGLHAILAVGLGLARRRSAPAWWAAAALLAASTVATNSRTGEAAMIAGLVVVPACAGLARIGRRVRLRWVLPALAAVVLLAAGAWAASGSDPLPERLAARLDRFEKSLDYRLDAWRNSAAIVRAHPALGIGPHTFVSVERFAPGSRFFNEPESPHPHDMFLYVAQSGGLAALLLLLAWLGLLVRALWEGYVAERQPVPRALLAAALGGTAAVVLANLFDLGLSLETVAPAPLFLLTGLALARCAPEAARPSPARGFLWSVALLALFVGLGARPLLAEMQLERAQVLAWQSDRGDDPAPLMAEARAAATKAITLFPLTPRAHDLLSRWQERLPGGYRAARETLEALAALAPDDAESHSLLAHLDLRAGVWDGAAEELRLALADGHGSRFQSRDRADLVYCLAKLGRRDEALAELVEALRLDSGVIEAMAWSAGKDQGFRLDIGGSVAQPPLQLAEAIERLFSRHRADHEAGVPVGRRFWMDTYRAFRVAGRDDRAADLLDYLEAQGIDDVEPETILSERGSLAADAGDIAQALACYEKAYGISANPFFLHRAHEMRRRLGEDVPADAVGQAPLEQTGEILDQPGLFLDYFEGLAGIAREEGRPGEAAALLERTLLFHEDPLDRVRLWQRIAELHLAAGETREVERALREALPLLACRPFPWRTLQLDSTTTLPGQLAETLLDAWKAQGLDLTARRHAAWGMPDFFGSRQGPTLFRLAMYAGNAQPDQLVREADLQLLGDPDHMPAHWARVLGLEASGQHLRLGAAMRTLVDAYTRSASPERQFQQLVGVMSSRLQDSDGWRALGVLSLLRGRYSEAGDFFRNARNLKPDDPQAGARLSGWVALSEFLAGRPAKARTALDEGLALDPGNDMLRLRRSVIPDEVGR